VVDVTADDDHDERRPIRPRVEVTQLGDAKRAHRLTRPENRVAVRVIAPERFVVQLEHEVVRRVVDRRDLFEHDLALEIEILRAQRRPKHDVGDNVARHVEVLVEHPRVVDRVFARGIGVERAAQCLELERDLLGTTPLRPLEHHVLEEVRNAHAVARLVQ
jgi:hypothetical protein